MWNRYYRSLQCSRQDFRESWRLRGLFFSIVSHSFIAGGDYNSMHTLWGSRASNQRGSALYRSLIKSHLSLISSPNPTYWPTHTNRLPKTLDFFISKIPNHINTIISMIYEVTSPILLSIIGNMLLNSRASLTNGRIDWDKFKLNLDQNINLKVALKSHSDVDNAMFKQSNKQPLKLYHLPTHTP